jgi:cytochrome c
MNNKLTYGLGAAGVAAMAVFVLTMATPQPGQQGSMSMTPPDTSSLDDGDPINSVLVPAEFSPEAQIGKRIFEGKCAVCHGKNATGQKGFAPPLVDKIYEPNHHGDIAFVMAAKNGVQSHHWDFGDMPPVEGLTDGDVKYIARYIRELQKENGIF